jgi:hypothetical protein
MLVLVDLNQLGGHLRVWRQSLRKGISHAKKYRLRYIEEFKAEAVQLARSSPERSVRQLAYEL